MHKYIHGYMYRYMHTHIFLKHLGVSCTYDIPLVLNILVYIY